jgi:hypothetical protein
MKVRFIAELEDLDSIREVIKSYNPIEIPDLTTQLNHVRVDDTAKIRLTIDGNDNDVKCLVDLLTSSFLLS